MNDPRVWAWLATRPPQVQRLAREFPLGSVFVWQGRRWYLVGYGEGADDLLLVSRINPAVDYPQAVATRVAVHADHFRLPPPPEAA